jgi:hypothetical protein
MNVSLFRVEKLYTIDLNDLDDDVKPLFEKDLSEPRIKGSIHHELTHWVDDTMNNQHIDKFIKNNEKKTAEENNVLKYINTHYLERQAQIHNIKQLHNYYITSLFLSSKVYKIYYSLSYN